MERSSVYGPAYRLICLSLVWSLIACAEEAIVAEESRNLELGIGSSGAEVEALHTQLAKLGYLPNEELATDFPHWSSPVPRPARSDSFDDSSAEAVATFQAAAGLPVTGRADAATLKRIREPGCGTPNHAGPKLSNEKFAHLGPNRARVNTFKFMTCSSPGIAQPCVVHAFTLSQMNAVRAAFATWASATDIVFTEVQDPTISDIQVHLTPLSEKCSAQSATCPCNGNPNALCGAYANAGFPPAGWINFDSNRTWDTAVPSAPGAIDLETIAVHEIGHTLGLDHSSVNPSGTDLGRPAMWAFASVLDRTLAADDRVAAQARYGVWTTLSGGARDVAAASATADIAWVIGTNAVFGGYGVWRSSGDAWVADAANGGGIRIAVNPSGIPWIVNDSGNIYRRSSNSASSGSWSQVPGCARDIAIGKTGDVYTIGCDPSWLGGYFVEKYDPTSNTFDSPPGDLGSGYAIAVHATGQPWVVTDSGSIYRRLPNGTWEPLAGTANDISADGEGYVYVVGTTAKTGGYDLFVWNEQLAAGSTAARQEWVQMTSTGVGTRIAAGAGGRLWTLTSTNAIRRLLP